MEFMNYIGPGLAVGLAGLGVAIGQGILAKKTMQVMGKKPEMNSFFLTITILGMALVESAVIYGFIIAFQILGNDSISLLGSIGAGLAIGLAGLGAGIGEGKLVAGAIGAIDKNPEAKAKIMTFMVLFIALVESAAIYGLVVAFKILGADDPSMPSLLGMGMAVGFAGLGVAIGEGIIADKAMSLLGKKSSLTSFFLTVTILGIALVESAAIYGLVISFDIFNKGVGLYASIGAGLSIGLAGLGAGIGEGMLIKGTLGAIDRNPELKGKMITFMVLFVALIEVTAIYGLIVAFRILSDGGVDSMAYVGAGLSIGLAGLGVAIGRGYLSEDSLLVMGKNPKMINFLLTVSILGVALVESAAIYALIISFQILGTENIGAFAAIGAGLAIGLTGLGAGVGEGKLVAGSLKAIVRNPELKGKLITFMVLFVALVEVTAIYGLIIAFNILADTGPDSMAFIGAGLSIGLAGLGVAIGRGYLSEESLLVIGKNSKMMSFLLTVSVLGVALVESAAIYAIIVSFQILGADNIGGFAAMGAGLAIGLAGLGAGVGEGILVAGSLKSIANNPEIRGKIMTLMVLFVALVESAAIYGLVVAFKILGTDDMTLTSFVGMGMAVGFAGLGVAIGEGILAKKAMSSIGKRPEMLSFFLTITILGIALVESAAIYGLVVAFDILNKELALYASMGAGLAIGLAGLGAGVGEGMLVSGALSAIERNPKIKGKIMTFMVLFVALVEVTAIYGFIIAFKIIGAEGTDSLMYVGAGLSIGLAGLGVAIGRGYLSEESIAIMGKNPKVISFLLTVSILGVALVESAAIYALIVSFQILGITNIFATMGAGLAIGFAGLGVGVGEGILIKGAMEGINKAPESKGRTLAFMVLFVALVEVVAIYGLIIAFKVLG